jgi:hypothetical protein
MNRLDLVSNGIDVTGLYKDQMTIVRMYYGYTDRIIRPFMSYKNVACTYAVDYVHGSTTEMDGFMVNSYSFQECSFDSNRSGLGVAKFLICGLEYHVAVMQRDEFQSLYPTCRPVRDSEIGLAGLALDSLVHLMQGTCDRVRRQ